MASEELSMEELCILPLEEGLQKIPNWEDSERPLQARKMGYARVKLSGQPVKSVPLFSISFPDRVCVLIQCSSTFTPQVFKNQLLTLFQLFKIRSQRSVAVSQGWQF